MAPLLTVTILVTAALVAVDGARRPQTPKQGSGLILEEEASLVNSSYRPNTGCRGRVTLSYTRGNTRDSCRSQFETQMSNPQSGGERRAQPPGDSGGWFMIDNTRRRRHRYYCGRHAEKHDCGGGNCMRVEHHQRRRFSVTCGQCTCHQPQATNATVCLTLMYAFQGGSHGHLNRTVSHTVGTRRERYTSQDTVHQFAVQASGNINGVIPSIGGTFGVTAETRYEVTSAFHSAFSESHTSEYSTSETLHLDMSHPVYILHAQNYIYFEDNSSSRLSGRTLLQFNRPVQAGCQQVWTRR